MLETLKDTTTSQVDKLLSRLRAETGARALSRVLTLVVLAEKGHSKKALQAAIEASHEHPCRIIVHIAHNPDKENRLDAEVSIGGDAGASELIVLRGWGESSRPTESLLSALLLPDAPIVVWWPHSLPEAPGETSLGRIAARRITDSARAERPWEALETLASAYRPGDTDLAWTRITQWRIQVAALLDDVDPERISRVVVEGAVRSPSVILLGTWLGTRLGAEVEVRTCSEPRGLYRVTLEGSDGALTVFRPGRTVATVSQPDARDQQISLPVRTLGECMAEELRRLDPDEAYGEVLTEGLGEVSISWTEVPAEECEGSVEEFTEVYDA